MRQGEPLKWRDAGVCGLLWGLVVLVAVSLSQPVGDLQLLELMRWVAGLAIVWGATGLVWAFGVKLAEDLKRPLLITGIVLATALATSVAANVMPIIGRQAPGDFGRIHQIPMFDLGVYSLWVNLFYGGLYSIGYFATRRTLRLRRNIADLQLMLSEAEAGLREARLKAVRGQMQPSMLLEALDALRRFYACDRVAADRLFDLLIAFLRAAMPGLRSGASTLVAEVSLIASYAALREALKIGPPMWRLSLAEPPPHLPFPPLRLLPALDGLSRAIPADAIVDVTGENSHNAFVVRVYASAPDPLLRVKMERLRTEMQQHLGSAAVTLGDLDSALVAEVRVPAAIPA